MAIKVLPSSLDNLGCVKQYGLPFVLEMVIRSVKNVHWDKRIVQLVNMLNDKQQYTLTLHFWQVSKMQFCFSNSHSSIQNANIPSFSSENMLGTITTLYKPNGRFHHTSEVSVEQSVDNFLQLCKNISKTITIYRLLLQLFLSIYSPTSQDL